MYRFAYNLASDDGVEKNMPEVARYMKMSADKGYLKAISKYGNMLYNGVIVNIDKKEACKYLKMAADKGDEESMLTLSDILINGEGVPADEEEGVKYLKTLAENGNPEAMRKYAKYLARSPNGIEKIIDICKYNKLAAEKGVF